MSLNLADVQTEYNKNKNLKKNEVEKVIEWVNNQPHLPAITEIQAIIFLHACYYDLEKTKKTIESFFTIKSSHPSLFKERNPLTSPIKESLNVCLFTPLPQQLKGHTLIFLKLMDSRPSSLQYSTQMKIFDMISMLHIFQGGTNKGYIIVIDMKGAVFGHLFRVSIYALKTLLLYVQEAIPGRIKAIHFFNVVPFMDRIMALITPFMRQELTNMFFLHQTVDDLSKVVPLELLPGDYGGGVEETKILHEKMKTRLCENLDFFEWEDQQCVDERKRREKGSRFWKF